MNKPLAFWSLSTTEMLQQLQAAKEGLTSAEARERLRRYGSNRLKPPKRSDVFTLLLAQFKSPLILILFFATALSFFLRETVDAFIILTIVLVSGLLGFWQERGASNAVEKLISIVRITAAVLRDGSVKETPVEEIVPGDIVILDAGDIVPGDCLLQESKDLFVDEAMPSSPQRCHKALVDVMSGEAACQPFTGVIAAMFSVAPFNHFALSNSPPAVFGVWHS